MGIQVLEKHPVAFKCTCSRERLEYVLKGIGKDELEAVLLEQGRAELNCHFCGEQYLFAEEELKEMIDESIQKS